MSISTLSPLTSIVTFCMLHDISYQQNGGHSPLHIAAFNDHDVVVATLLKNGANVNQENSLGWTPLHNAAAKGNNAVVVVLLSNGADFNKVDNDGLSPLYFAAENGHDAVVASLIEKGADVNKGDIDGDRPIDVAKTQKIKDMLITLTEEKQEDQGQTAVPKVVDEAQWFRAAKKGKLALIKQGISDKIDVNCLDSGGRTALHWATFQGHLHLVEYLVIQHADVNIANVSANDAFDQYIL